MLTEQRKSTRKILKTRALFAPEGAPPLAGRTSDVSAEGVSIGFQDPLPAGQGGQVRLDLLVEGKVTPIVAKAKVSYCIFSGGEFKVGFQFLNLELSMMTALSKFLR